MSTIVSERSARFERHRWIRRRLWAGLPHNRKGIGAAKYREALRRATAEYYARGKDGEE